MKSTHNNLQPKQQVESSRMVLGERRNQLLEHLGQYCL